MFHYRQVLVRLRAGDSVRELARSGLMGRDKLATLRSVAQQQGWLDPQAQVPDDQAIASAMGQGRRASSTVSSVEPRYTLPKLPPSISRTICPMPRRIERKFFRRSSHRNQVRYVA